jgi:RNA polymerase sigma-B factor
LEAPPGTLSEKELLRRVRESKDQVAREELITRYLPLVKSLARRFASRGQPVEDLIQVGSIGLIKAIDRFDLDRGVELSTYATPTIMGEIKRYFRDKGWAVKVPRALQDLNVRLNRVIEQLTVELHRSPTIAELAAATSVTEEEVVEALESGRAYSSVSLFAGGANDEDDSLGLLDTLGAEEQAYDVVEQRRLLAPAMSQLDPRERLILHLRFFEGLTQTQIAARVGISQMHVSRLIRKSIENLRLYMEEEENLAHRADEEEED